MPLDLKFDPLTQDLIDDGAGGFELTDTAETAVLHTLACHESEWWGHPGGSRLHDLEAFEANPETQIPDEVRRALAPLVRTGRIDQLRARAVEEGPGRVVVETSFRDRDASQAVTIVVRPSRA